MAQLINITSEALQATIRRLLPSQQGFGEDLQATNVVTPIIDLTPTAEGSLLPTYLQRAMDYASDIQDTRNAINVLANGAGFYQVHAISNINQPTAGGPFQTSLFLFDGSASKTFWKHVANNAGSNGSIVEQFSGVVWLNAGDSLRAQSNDGAADLTTIVRQVANSTGELVNPTGFVSQ